MKLEQVTSQKVLGMMLDEKLDFKDYMNYQENIARSNLCKIKDLYNKHFWLPTISRQFESIQGEVMRAIIKISGKVSQNALDVEGGILPTSQEVL